MAGTFRHETTAVARLALPVMLAHLGTTLMGTVDAMMLGRFSATALAAGALGHSLSFALLSFPMGILMALDPLVAQAFGAQQPQRIRVAWRQGLLLAVLLSLPIAALTWDCRFLLRVLGQQPEVAEQAYLYLRGLIPGNLAFLLIIAARQTLQAMSITRPVVVATIIGNLVNVGANYLLIFGHGGFPAMGVLGSALATSLARAVMFGVVLAAMPKVFAQLGGAAEALRLSWRGIREQFRLGLPIGLHLALEICLFALAALLMGYLGTHEIAGHQVAINLASLSFMLPLGIGGAAATRVGNAIGRGDQPQAQRSALICLGMGAGIMSLSALTFAFAPGFLSRLYTADPVVLDVAMALLPIAAAFQIFDGLQVVSAGILRGLADTRWPAAIALFGFWGLGLPLAYFFAFRLGLGPRGLWWGLTSGLAAVAILLLIRVRRRFQSHIQALVE